MAEEKDFQSAVVAWAKAHASLMSGAHDGEGTWTWRLLAAESALLKLVAGTDDVREVARILHGDTQPMQAKLRKVAKIDSKPERVKLKKPASKGGFFRKT